MAQETVIENLTGVELDQAFGEGIRWLRDKVYDPLEPNKLYHYAGGSISMRNQDHLIFQIDRDFADGTWERYLVGAKNGLISFAKETHALQVESSILGALDLNPDDRYFVDLIREETTVSFGPNWLERKSQNDPQAKLAVEKKRRAALMVIRACQS